MRLLKAGKQLEASAACGLAKGDTVHVLGRIEGGSDFFAWMDELVLNGENDLVDWDDEEDVVQWMMEGRDRPRSGKRTRLWMRVPNLTAQNRTTTAQRMIIRRPL